MKSIKKIAGDILIYFYTIHRQGAALPFEIIYFYHNQAGQMHLTKESESSEVIRRIYCIADNNATDTYGALNYLREIGFIDCKISESTSGYMFHNIHVTATGIDIIEGVERGEREKDKFHITFNIKLADNINLESLIKTELGGLIQLKPF